MKDKAIEFLMSYIPDSTNDKTINECIEAMLEFGHYVAEEQKKQCLKEALICYQELEKLDEFENEIWSICEVGKLLNGNTGDYVIMNVSILNAKNVCNEQ
jgi:hypothetical protein